MTPIHRCAFLSAALLFAAPVALGQPAPASTNNPLLSESLHGPAKDAFDSATLLFLNGDFVGALTKFRQAYELSKDPRLLYQMAICEKNLRHYARMQSLLAQYLRDGGPTISAENRAVVEKALSAIRNLVATLTVTANEPGATVMLDGEAVGRTPLAAPLLVDLGRHTLVAKKPGYESVEQTIDTPGGSPTSVALKLSAQAHAARLVLTSDDDATVRVDGQVVGKGRFEGVLAPGLHEVSVAEVGKAPYQTQIELRDGEVRTVQVTLESPRQGAGAWPWVVGGIALAAGATVGGYFLFKS
ncbi:MAG TPA: PEGA domain-containing protein, partial [Polyangiaceae bacterium]|nr:PEGA domain-containing protein [Polyangiaceae bacterium]